MSNFNRIYKSILTEGRIPSIFKKATPEDVAERKVQYGKVRLQEFLERKDVRRNEDGSYDVDGNVDFSAFASLTRLPVRFRNVGGDFYCNRTPITSLEGAPTTVGGAFWCLSTRITSLEGSPTTVGGSFLCYNTNITSLDGAPTMVGGNFWCHSCGRKFTVAEVRNYCKVKGAIHV